MPVDQGTHIMELRRQAKSLGNSWVGLDSTGHYLILEDNVQ